MQIKNIAMMVAAGCALGMLTGCGVSKEEHNEMISQMSAERAESEGKLNGKIADLESVVKSEKAKIRTGRIELDDASERIKALQQKSAESASALATEKGKTAQLETDLTSSKSKVLVAQDRAEVSDKNCNTLYVEYQELKRRFEMFQKNMSSLNSSSSSATTSAASSVPTSSVKSLLDSMGNM